MGSTASRPLAEVVRATQLEPLTTKVVGVGPSLCFHAPKTWLLATRRKVNPLSCGSSLDVEITAQDVTDGVGGAIGFRMDGLQVLWNAHNDPVAVLVGNTFTKGFDVLDTKTNRRLLTIERVLRRGVPTTVALFHDRFSGVMHTIGYTGDWSRRHQAVLWITAGKAREPVLQPIAKVYPSATGTCLSRSYVVEVTPGMDTGLVLLVCYVLDYAGDNLVMGHAGGS